MYNHYIPDDTIFDPIPEEDSDRTYKEKKSNPFSFLFSGSSKSENKKSGFSDILKKWNLGDIDASDILLILILLFLFLEGDNWEVAIILGIVLFLSFKSDDAV